MEILRKQLTVFKLSFVFFAFFVAANFASATTIVPDIYSGGYFTGDVVWKKADSPYVVTNAIFSNTSSLTIEPGTIIKFNSGYGILVRGRLDVGSASSTEKVYFTSIKDDAVGGDTNNDATSTLPRAGNWGGFNFAGPDGTVGSINNAIFRYGGSGGTSAGELIVFGGQLALSNVQITDSKSPAILQTAGTVSITDSDITSRCGGIRFSGGALDIAKSNLAIDYSLPTGQCSMFASPKYAVDNRGYTFVSAVDNWWGSPSGPQHISNLSGVGSAISGNVDFTPWLMSDPFSTSTCTQNCFSNVLFLPGLEASRLYRPDYDGGTDQLWEPNANSDAEDLFLTSEGKSVRGDVYTKDVIDEAYLGGPNIYKSFIEQMDGLKTDDTIVDWKSAPYDWRLSLDDILDNGREFSGGRIYYAGDLAATSTPYIIQELRRLASTSKTGKVTIVAHSNGGLVTKALTEKLGSEAATLIDKIIFIAVPQIGTPQAIGALLHGYEQGLPKDWLHFFLNPEIARTLAENMPSAYNLLPSANYFTSVSEPVVTFEDKPILEEFRARYGNEIRNGAQLKNFITDTWRFASSSPSDLEYPSVGNATLLSRAETTHDTLDGWTPPAGVSLYEIAGWGEDTLATIEYYEGKQTIRKEVQASFPFAGTYWTNVTIPAISYTPKEVLDGDGTVVAPSALWSTASTTGKWWVDLLKYDSLQYGNFERKHADILEIPELRTFINNILTNTTSTSLNFITNTRPTTEPFFKKDRLSFLLHSPLNLSATDNLGNVVSFATSTINGASFKRYGEVQVLKVLKGAPITLNLNGYATGSFTLDMEEIDGLNNVVASTTFSAVPSATSTTATISFPDGTLQTATPLFVDYDNDGATDFTLRPSIGKEVIFDTTPPEASISFSTTTQQLLVEGIDESLTTIFSAIRSTTITDESGNTLEITFNKLKQEGNEIKTEIQTLAYNGVSTSEIQKIALQYEWSTDKAGNLKELEQKATAGSFKVEAHYDAKKNTTTIKKKMKESDDEKEIKETFVELRILKLVTENGIVRVDY